mmetsp:Transcript_40575/g.76035  ORF Transcript_40575/g.76035 Transcript_40575/m.76035 type:complete len:212 (+) Transcript_40575:251-886(+)
MPSSPPRASPCARSAPRSERGSASAVKTDRGRQWPPKPIAVLMTARSLQGAAHGTRIRAEAAATPSGSCGRCVQSLANHMHWEIHRKNQKVVRQHAGADNMPTSRKPASQLEALPLLCSWPRSATLTAPHPADKPMRPPQLCPRWVLSEPGGPRWLPTSVAACGGPGSARRQSKSSSGFEGGARAAGQRGSGRPSSPRSLSVLRTRDLKVP